MDHGFDRDTAELRDTEFANTLPLVVSYDLAGTQLLFMHLVIGIGFVDLVFDLYPGAQHEFQRHLAWHRPALVIPRLDRDLRGLVFVVNVAVGKCSSDNVAARGDQTRA